MDIGARIKEVRISRGLSTYELAQLIGVSQSAISKLENGKRKADQVILEKLSEALNISIDRLTGESLSVIIKKRLDELGMSLEEVAENSGVSLYWLQTLDTFIPGQWGEYEIGYDWITKVAEVIGLSGSTLRAALARQEIPAPDDLPRITAAEAFNPSHVNLKEQSKNDAIKSFITKTEQDHLYKYRSVDEKGKHTVDTVLEMEYNRCKSTNKGIVIQLSHEDKTNLEPLAAHDRTDIEVTDEMKQNDKTIIDKVKKKYGK